MKVVNNRNLRYILRAEFNPPISPCKICNSTEWMQLEQWADHWECSRPNCIYERTLKRSTSLKKCEVIEFKETA